LNRPTFVGGLIQPVTPLTLNYMNWKKFAVVAQATKAGCKSETPQGIARFLRKRQHLGRLHPGLASLERGERNARNIIGGIARQEFIDRKFMRVRRHGLYDQEMMEYADTNVRARNKRLKNWNDPKPTLIAGSHNEMQPVDGGRYKGRWSKKTVWSYTPLYHSALHLYRSGLTVELHAAGQMVRRLRAPAGLRFDSDSLGVRVVAKDGTDYHPTAGEWRSPKFATLVRSQLAAKRVAIKDHQIAQRDSRRLTQIRERGMATCRVSLEDSRRAGNCTEGALRFAESRLGMDRAEIVAGGHLVHVAGSRLLATGDDRAKAAVLNAWKRETTISI